MAKLPLLLALGALAPACGGSPLYVEVEEPSLAITQTLPAVPGAPAVAVPSAELPPGGVDVTVGSFAVDTRARGSRLTLNAARLVLLSPAAGTSFAGIASAALSVAPPAGSSLPAAVVATFDAARDGAAGVMLPLAAVPGVDLLPYLASRSLHVTLTASGTPPGPVGGSWTADLTLDFHLVAKVGYP